MSKWKSGLLADTQYPLGVPTHHYPYERISQPRLWTNHDEVADFARKMSVTLEIEILVRRVEGGWILPYYFAIWNGWVETAESGEERDDYWRHESEMAACSQRDDDIERKNELDEQSPF